MKNKNRKRPIESHKTAAWADTNHVKPESQVPVPSETQTKDAKSYVDQNEK